LRPEGVQCLTVVANVGQIRGFHLPTSAALGGGNTSTPVQSTSVLEAYCGFRQLKKLTIDALTPTNSINPEGYLLSSFKGVAGYLGAIPPTQPFASTCIHT
jgi:hypothetical protein